MTCDEKAALSYHLQQHEELLCTGIIPFRNPCRGRMVKICKELYLPYHAVILHGVLVALLLLYLGNLLTLSKRPLTPYSTKVSQSQYTLFTDDGAGAAS